MRIVRTSLAAALVAIVPSIASAQINATGLGAPGTADPNWQVKCEILVVGVTNPACSERDDFAPAIISAANPGGWANDPLAPTNARYIGLTESNTIGGNQGENPRYRYTFRTTVTIPDFAAYTQLVLDPLWLDNYWVGFAINEGPINTLLRPLDAQGNPTVAPNGNNWNRRFTLVIPEGSFNQGANTLDIIVDGNGLTDGLLVAGRLNVVPEPSTYALMATGLAGLATLARRRRTRA